MKLGLSTESFCSAIQGGRMNLIKIIEFAHQHGFEGIQIINNAATWRKDISDDIKMNLMRLRERKIRYYSYGVKNDLSNPDKILRWRSMNKVREAILLASITNVSDVCIYGTGVSEEKRSWDDMSADVILALRDCVELAERKHVKISLVNAGTACNGTAVLRQIVDSVNSEYFKICLDTAAFLLVDEDPAVAVRELSDCISNVNVTDVNIAEEVIDNEWTAVSNRQFVPCALGEGVMPQREVIQALKEIDFKGHVCVLYQGSEEPAVGIERSANFLKTVLREVRN